MARDLEAQKCAWQYYLSQVASQVYPLQSWWRFNKATFADHVKAIDSDDGLQFKIDNQLLDEWKRRYDVERFEKRWPSIRNTWWKRFFFDPFGRKRRAQLVLHYVQLYQAVTTTNREQIRKHTGALRPYYPSLISILEQSKVLADSLEGFNNALKVKVYEIISKKCCNRGKTFKELWSSAREVKQKYKEELKKYSEGIALLKLKDIPNDYYKKCRDYTKSLFAMLDSLNEHQYGSIQSLIAKAKSVPNVSFSQQTAEVAKMAIILRPFPSEFPYLNLEHAFHRQFLLCLQQNTAEPKFLQAIAKVYKHIWLQNYKIPTNNVRYLESEGELLIQALTRFIDYEIELCCQKLIDLNNNQRFAETHPLLEAINRYIDLSIISKEQKQRVLQAKQEFKNTMQLFNQLVEIKVNCSNDIIVPYNQCSIESVDTLKQVNAIHRKTLLTNFAEIKVANKQSDYASYFIERLEQALITQLNKFFKNHLQKFFTLHRYQQPQQQQPLSTTTHALFSRRASRSQEQSLMQQFEKLNKEVFEKKAEKASNKLELLIYQALLSLTQKASEVKDPSLTPEKWAEQMSGSVYIKNLYAPIRKYYRKIMREFHPDKNEDKAHSLKTIVSTISSEINDRYGDWSENGKGILKACRCLYLEEFHGDNKEYTQRKNLLEKLIKKQKSLINLNKKIIFAHEKLLTLYAKQIAAASLPKEKAQSVQLSM